MKMVAARSPNASALPEWISSAAPGANPRPRHSVVGPAAITQAKPLRPFFCTEASLTSMSDRLADSVR